MAVPGVLNTSPSLPPGRPAAGGPPTPPTDTTDESRIPSVDTKPPQGLLDLARLELARVLECDAKPDWPALHDHAAEAVMRAYAWGRPAWILEKHRAHVLAGWRKASEVSRRALAVDTIALRVWVSIGCEGNALPCADAAEVALRELEASRKRGAA